VIETHDLYLRALAVPVAKSGKKKKATQVGKLKTDDDTDAKWPEVLAFDTESRTEVDQSLTFSVWRRCRLVGQNYEVLEEGIFYADDLPAKELKVLKTYMETAVSDVVTFPPAIPALFAYAVHEEGLLASSEENRRNGCRFQSWLRSHATCARLEGRQQR
jgi:hypothetical protein